MLKAVIFDMDGVIIDSEPIHAAVEKEIFINLGLDITDEEHDTFVGTSSRNMWGLLKEKYGLKENVEELVKSNKDTYVSVLTSKEGLKPIAGIPQLIRQLKKSGIRLALASSSAYREINLILGMFELDKYFEVLASGEEVTNGKPAPDIFLLAAERLGCEPSTCTVIEDSTNGARAAKAAGMKCIGYKGKNGRNQDLSIADLVVTNLLDIDADKIKVVFD